VKILNLLKKFEYLIRIDLFFEKITFFVTSLDHNETLFKNQCRN